MKRLIFLLLVFGWLAGCAHYDPAGPRNEAEAFPFRNQDPRWGLVVNEGSAHLNINIYDEAGRLVEQTYLSGVNRFFTVNNQTFPNYWLRQLEYGTYRVEIYPFYYQIYLLGPLFEHPIRYRIDLPKQTASIVVSRNPTAYYDSGYSLGGTYRHWGWICRLNGGNIPDTAHGFPGINFGIQGNFGR